MSPHNRHSELKIISARVLGEFQDFTKDNVFVDVGKIS